MQATTQTSGRSIGLDGYKHLVVVCIIRESGQVVLRHRCICSRSDLEQFGRRYLQPTDKAVLKATTNTSQVVAVLKPFVAEVVVSNPLKTKAVAEAKIKTDKVDALVLAQQLRCDFLPRVWEPPVDTQQLRRQTARRAALVAAATAIKSRIDAVLHQRLIKSPMRALFCKQGRQWLTEVELDEEGRTAIESDIRLLGYLEADLAEQEKQLVVQAYANEQVKLLMTLPGVSITVAQTLRLWVTSPGFGIGAHAASYLGLVPRTH